MKSLILLLILMPTVVFGYQASVVVPNGTGAQVRTNMNNAFMALSTEQSGTTAPSTAYPYQLWVDTSANPAVIKMRNAANTAWLVIGAINDSNGFVAASTSAGNSTSVGGFIPSQTPTSNQVVVVSNDGYTRLPEAVVLPNNKSYASKNTSGVAQALLYINSVDSTIVGTTNNPTYIYSNGIIKDQANNTFWHSGNDGVGSGLDADKLDGFRLTYGWGGTDYGVNSKTTSSAIALTPIQLDGSGFPSNKVYQDVTVMSVSPALPIANGYVPNSSYYYITTSSSGVRNLYIYNNDNIASYYRIYNRVWDYQ